jgi:MFS transporter, FSR family, fosmidomycin resistance protein
MAESRFTKRIPLLLGTIHAFVDLLCVTAVLRALRTHDMNAAGTYAIVVGYDLIAFAVQLPLGLLVDKVNAPRAASIAGVVLSAMAVLSATGRADVTMVLAGIGNALFHVGAGGVVLANTRGRAAPAGLFVAPGSLGLGLGLWLGPRAHIPTWPLLMLAAVSVAGAALVSAPLQPQPPAVEQERGMPARLWLLALVLLLLSATVRGFIESVGCQWCPKATFLMVALPLVGFTARLLGGYASDRLGWVETSVGALLLSAPLIAFNHGSVVPALVGLLLFQMTMPVTLMAVWRVMPRRPATAFGFPCVGLVVGTIVSGEAPIRRMLDAPFLLGLVAASATALLLALELIGIRRRQRSAPETSP